MWRFAAALRLSSQGTMKFEKVYHWERWIPSGVNYYPVAITTTKVLEDIKKGTDFSWDPPPDPKGKKKKTKRNTFTAGGGRIAHRCQRIRQMCWQPKYRPRPPNLRA